MVTVEGPSPRTGRGRSSEEDKVVAEFVHHGRGFYKFAKEMVDAHCADGLVVSLRGESGLQDGKNGVADSGGDFVETKALVAEQELGVGPGAPFRAVDVVAESLLLRGGEQGEEALGFGDDVLDGHLFVLQFV